MNQKLCPASQNMTFPHISYTYLAEDKAKLCKQTKCLENLAHPTDFLHVRNPSFCLVSHMPEVMVSVI